MSSMEMTTFPAVATVIGVSQDVVESGPLLATLGVDPIVMGTPPPTLPTETTPVDIQAGDPVTQAVVDNIIGKHPTKKEPVKFKCEVCNISVSSVEILNIHYNGLKHAKKVKGQELVKEITNSQSSMFILPSAQIGVNSNINEFTCKMCNVKVNSSQQLTQHLLGSKHKNKAGAKQMNTTNFTVPINSSGQKGEVSVDIGPNRLYCAACNIHVNSDLQLHQHITSNKHTNKVNGRNTPATRGTPYNRPKAQRSASIFNNWEKKFFVPQQQQKQHNNWPINNWPNISRPNNNGPNNNWPNINRPNNDSHNNWSHNTNDHSQQHSTPSAGLSGTLFYRR